MLTRNTIFFLLVFTTVFLALEIVVLLIVDSFFVFLIGYISE